MSAETVREGMSAALKPLLDEWMWRWIPEQREPDTLDAIAVIWKQSRITRLPEAPLGHVRVDGVLTVVSPKSDVAEAESQLDDAVTDLCIALDGIKGIAWTEARKVGVNDKYFGWDIDVWTTASPTATRPMSPTEPEPDDEPDQTEGD